MPKAAQAMFVAVACLIACAVVCECSDRVSEQGRSRLLTDATSPQPSSRETRGGIKGTAVDCQGQPLRSTEVYATPEPDTLLRDVHTVYDMMILSRTSESIATLTDSLGQYAMDDVPVGDYQVTVSYDPTERLQPLECGAGAIDRVRVAPDSISIVDISQINAITEVIPMARIWEPHYIPVSK